VSRSPRRLLRTAAEALEALGALAERYPEARQEIEAAVGGPERLATLEAARTVLREAVGAPQEPATE
jgi:hypothetical protein